MNFKSRNISKSIANISRLYASQFMTFLELNKTRFGVVKMGVLGDFIQFFSFIIFVPKSDL